MFDPILTGVYLSTARPSYYFSPGFNSVSGYRGPFGLTIHDLIHLHVPGEQSAAKKLYYRALLKPALKRARHVFTVSEYSKQDILQWSNIDKQKIVVVGNGVSSVFTPEGYATTYQRPYLFYVGNHKPHKNTLNAIKAFKISRTSYTHDFLLSGPPRQHVTDFIAREGLIGKVRFTGMLEEQDLASHYRGATSLIMPSLYEGFGLPVIEAMACGCPVVSSDRTALTEVGGQAAIYFNPEHVDAIADAIDQTLDKERVEHMSLLALANSARFNWQTVADLINSAIAGA
ncbi:glycosyltransferase family 1 protein [Salinisphaera sp. SPP-AMP-43]|uniref:glycosyltransferase family 4 protein n=1 Tax=Salinisphaera sp. SPP-AMP-43 TaxID=3121288 RepID=UPI003C6DEA3C